MDRVLKYGARPESVSPKIREQMYLGNRYYNALVEAENKRRKAVWLDLYGEEKADPPPHKGHKRGKCVECDAHYQELYGAIYKDPLDRIPFRTVASQEGLYWGSYLMRERAFLAACKDTKPWKLLRFRSWHENQLVAVQIQPRARAENYYRIRESPDPRTGRRSRGEKGRHTIQIRIGTSGRKPIWSYPVEFERHRIFDQGRVTWAVVTLLRRGPWEEASVQLTYNNQPKKPHGEGLVAVDIGWRKERGEIRAAWARDEQGVDHVLRMSAEWVELADRADRIRGARDDMYNDFSLCDPEAPICDNAPKGRNAIQKLGVPTLGQREWEKHDRHLWQYETGCRRRSVRVRRDKMRQWVNMLRNRYGEVVLKDTSHKEIKEDSDLHQKARRNGHHAAPGELVDLLKREFAGSAWVVPAEYTTQTCLECGHKTDIGAVTIHVCESCGAEADRDIVSTENILALHREGQSEKVTTRKSGGRWAKRHKKTK